MKLNWKKIWKDFDKIYRQREKEKIWVGWVWQRHRIEALVNAQLKRKKP